MVVHSISIRTDKIYEVTELLYNIAVFLNTCNTNLQYFLSNVISFVYIYHLILVEIDLNEIY